MKDFRSCVNSLVRTYRPIRWRVRVSMLVGLVAVAASLSFVWESKRVVDISTGALDAPLDTNVAALLAIMALQILCSVFSRYWQGRVVVKMQNSTRETVFARVLGSRWTGKEKFHSGDTVNRLEDDIQEVSSFLTANLSDVVITISQLTAASVYFFTLAPDLAWILLLIMPVAVIGSRLFFKKMRSLTMEIRSADSRLQGYMQENIQHRVLVKTLGSSGKVLEKLGILQKDIEDKTIVRLNYSAVSRSFMHVGFTAGYALVFLWGVYGLRDGSVTYGMMVAFLQLVGQVQRPVSNLASQIPAFIRALASQERLSELMDQPQDSEEPDTRFPGIPGVKVENLTFSYEDSDDKVLQGFSCDIKPGTLAVIVGPTGAGKSTLARIIMGLLSPDSGTVTIYDSSSSAPASASAMSNFMYVPQGNSLMSGSIRENLLMANPMASESELREALHLAVADFVLSLKDGLDTVCSEVGGGLSEGQAQRIAIARALLRPGGILLLDEATSSLDPETEVLLLDRLSAAFGGRKTIICITHRQAVASYADVIIRLREPVSESF